MRRVACVIRPITLLLVLGSLCATASAQSAGPGTGVGSTATLVPGARVRIRVEGESQPIVGVVLATSADSLLIESGPRQEGRVVAISALSLLEVSRGHSSYAPIGAMLGAVAGGTIGGMKDRGVRIITEDLWIVDVVIGASAGALAGALLAEAFDKEQWEQVALPGQAPRISFAPRVSARGISVGLTF